MSQHNEAESDTASFYTTDSDRVEENCRVENRYFEPSSSRVIRFADEVKGMTLEEVYEVEFWGNSKRPLPKKQRLRRQREKGEF